MKRKPAPGLEQFIRQYGIERDSEGRLILYKAVEHDFSPWFDDRWRRSVKGAYRPGTRVVNRRGVDRDRSLLCSFGLHVGTLKCAQGFSSGYGIGYRGGHIVKVLVDPEDVGCVPHSALSTDIRARFTDQKIRVRALTVLEIVPGEDNE